MSGLRPRSTKCLLVQPPFSPQSFWNYAEVCRLVGARYPAAPLGLMTVAGLLPQQWAFRLIDENVKPLSDADLDWGDIVCTGGMLPQQQAILRLIDHVHAKGRPVVVGGADPTSQPGLYQAADFLVLGEGEVTIPLFLEDLAKGVTSGIYCSSERADMTRAVVPRFDLIRFADYLQVGIQFSRGCPFNCEFCDITELFGRKPRCKTPHQILTELQALYDLGYRGLVDLVDDNFIGNRPQVIELLQAMQAWSERHHYPFCFSTEASINLAGDEQLLRLLQHNDFRFVFLGIESPDDEVLAEAQKGQNRGVSVVKAVRTLAAYGLVVNGGFILGFDHETEHTARNMIHLIQESGIVMAMVGGLYALAGTRLSRRLSREGRLFACSTIVMDGPSDIDQTTSGLNFATVRPRGDILEDQARVLEHIYDPRQYYERVLRTATQLRPAGRHRPRLSELPGLARSFWRVCRKVGLGHGTARLYWQTLFQVLVRNPKAVDVAVNLAAMYIHFARQSEFVVRMLRERAATIRRCDEEAYNARMVAGRAGEVDQAAESPKLISGQTDSKVRSM